MASISTKICSRRKMPNGTRSSPSRYCIALWLLSLFFERISFSLSWAFCFTSGAAFMRRMRDS